jgi:hypothetical protein
MIEKMVQTAKHAVKAMVLNQSAPSAPLCLAGCSLSDIMTVAPVCRGV